MGVALSAAPAGACPVSPSPGPELARLSAAGPPARPPGQGSSERAVAAVLQRLVPYRRRDPPGLFADALVRAARGRLPPRSGRSEAASPASGVAPPPRPSAPVRAPRRLGRGWGSETDGHGPNDPCVEPGSGSDCLLRRTTDGGPGMA